MEASPIEQIFRHFSDAPPRHFIESGFPAGDQWKAQGAELERADWLWSRRPWLWATRLMMNHPRRMSIAIGASGALCFLPTLLISPVYFIPCVVCLWPTLGAGFYLRIRHEECWRRDYARALFRLVNQIDS